MFLNLHPRTNKRLSLGSSLPRQKTYLSSLNNKEKSYSTASLKEEFRQFKNKSLSHTLNHHSSSSYLRPQQQFSPINSVSRQQVYQQKDSSFAKYGYKNGGNLRVDTFKKSYLNLDSKLNKCTKPKDYFKPIIQPLPSQFQPSAQSYLKIANSYLQAQKRINEQNNSKRSLVLIEEIGQVRQENEILKRQNQELRKQRSVDLELIARQNQVMQQQEELITTKNQLPVNINRFHLNSQSPQKDSNTYTFSKTQKALHAPKYECTECYKRNHGKNFQSSEFFEIKMQKIEEEKKLMKKEIHELVYQCEKLKELLSKTESKYQKELEQNQKLIKLIASDERYNKQDESNSSSLINAINRQPYLNLKNSINPVIHESVPVSIKRQKGKISVAPSKMEQKSQLNSPIGNASPKLSSYKSASNLIKYHMELQNQGKNWQHKENQQQWPGKNYFSLSNETNERQYQRNKQKSNNIEWCQNENIRNYLEEINKQKIFEINKIQNLLSNQ